MKTRRERLYRRLGNRLDNALKNYEQAEDRARAAAMDDPARSENIRCTCRRALKEYLESIQRELEESERLVAGESIMPDEQARRDEICERMQEAFDLAGAAHPASLGA